MFDSESTHSQEMNQTCRVCVFVFVSFFASKLNQKVRTVVHLGILEANKRRQTLDVTKKIFYMIM